MEVNFEQQKILIIGAKLQFVNFVTIARSCAGSTLMSKGAMQAMEFCFFFFNVSNVN